MASFTGGMGISFQADNHLPGGCGTAAKCNIIMAAAPQRKVASMMDLPCARPFRLSELARDGGQACSRSPEYWRWGR
jgi:hypothetical protein